MAMNERPSPRAQALCQTTSTDIAYAARAHASGYVQANDGPALLTLATEHDVVLRIGAEPGRFVHHGTTLVMVWPSATVNDALCESFRRAFIIGSARTPTQDVQFFVEQLVELVIRALSPGINDPGTARMCLDRLGHTLCQMATREMPASCRYDDDGHLRVMARPVAFEAWRRRHLTKSFATVGQVCPSPFICSASFGMSSDT